MLIRLVAIPEGGERNRSGDLSRIKVSECGHHGITGGRGGFPSGVVATGKLMCMMHAKRVTVMPKDIQLARRIREGCLTCGNLYN